MRGGLVCGVKGRKASGTGERIWCPNAGSVACNRGRCLHRDTRCVLLSRLFVQGAEQFCDEPVAVVGGVVEPRASQHDELDLVGRVPHLLECAQPAFHLPIGVEFVERRPLARGLVRKVAFRHALVIGAINAAVGARPRLGDDGDRRDTRCTAPWFHLQRLHESPVKLIVDVPCAPNSSVFSARLQVEGENALLGEHAPSVMRLG